MQSLRHSRTTLRALRWPVRILVGLAIVTIGTAGVALAPPPPAHLVGGR